MHLWLLIETLGIFYRFVNISLHEIWENMLWRRLFLVVGRYGAEIAFSMVCEDWFWTYFLMHTGWWIYKASKVLQTSAKMSSGARSAGICREKDNLRRLWSLSSVAHRTPCIFKIKGQGEKLIMFDRKYLSFSFGRFS